ncbi:hypothetical protein LTR53_007888 [Teratosphaeriaceae sp. CCFEE 6253]|nr:hypothetical protein LTR53_007888 [Teratosphaeriaceae sp. CCFEE 6253]
MSVSTPSTSSTKTLTTQACPTLYGPGHVLDKSVPFVLPDGSLASRKAWIRDLLANDPRAGGGDSDSRIPDDLRSGLRALYTSSGARRRQVRDLRHVGTKLRARKIVWVGKFWINEEFRSSGTGTRAWQDFHSALALFRGEERVVRGMMLLQADVLDWSMVDAGRSMGEIQADLVRFYGRSGYRVAWRQEPGRAHTYKLMCRLL